MASSPVLEHTETQRCVWDTCVPRRCCRKVVVCASLRLAWRAAGWRGGPRAEMGVAGRPQSLRSERLPPSLPTPLSPNAAVFLSASWPTPAVWPGHQHPQRPRGSLAPLLSFSRLVSLKCESDFWRLSPDSASAPGLRLKSRLPGSEGERGRRLGRCWARGWSGPCRQPRTRACAP